MTKDIATRLHAWGAPIFDEVGVSVYDIEMNSGRLLVMIDKPGGVDLDDIARCTRGLSALLDERDPIDGRYTLEVSSPGLERRLRTVEHRRAAVGETVKCKARDADGRVYRVEGRLDRVDDTDMVVESSEGPVVVPHDQVTSARTVFVWPGEQKSEKRRTKKKRRAKSDRPPQVRNPTS